jgi:hypothetical protein
MNIPSGKSSSAIPNQDSPDNAASNQNSGEKMSLFYLLQHYSKENKAIYKEQKNNKKKNASTPSAPPKKQTKTPSNDFGFVMPGQDNGSVQPTAPESNIPKQPNFAASPIPSKQPQAYNSGASVGGNVGNRDFGSPASGGVVMPQSSSDGMPLSFGETVVLGDGGMDNTVVLDSIQEIKMNSYLLRLKNNERIPINKGFFRIGKEKSYVDYCIGDNNAISRSHANIIKKGDDFYIVDTNSTNHTYVDNIMIKSNIEVILKHGAKIRLGNEEFEFYLY